MLAHLRPSVEQLEPRLAPTTAPSALGAIVQAARAPAPPPALVTPLVGPPSAVTPPPAPSVVPPPANVPLGNSVIAVPPATPNVVETPPAVAPPAPSEAPTAALPQPELIAVALAEPEAETLAFVEAQSRVEPVRAPVVTVVDVDAAPVRADALPLLAWVVGMVGLAMASGGPLTRKRVTSPFSCALPAGS